MPVQPIRLFGDPVLRTPAEPVIDFDKELRTLVADLTETMLEAPGQGLAAPQIGVGLRVFTFNVHDSMSGHLVNPVIVFREGQEKGEEGCLSIPGVWDDVVRARRIHVRAVDETGKPVEVDAEGYLARAIQHEVDHLDGVLFVDRLSLLKRQFLRRDLEAIARGELPEGHQPPQAASGS